MRMGLGIGLSTGMANVWTPSNASILLVGWYKGDVGFTAGGTWADQSGTTNDLVAQGSGFVVGPSLNAHQTITQGASGGWLLRSTFALGAAGSITIGGVFQMLGTGTAVVAANYTDTVFDEHGFGYWGASVPTPGFVHNAGANSSLGSTDLHNAWKSLVMTDTSGGTQTLYVQNVLEASQANGGGIADNLQLRLGLSSSFNLAELVVYRGVLSSTDRGKLHSYFAAKYGI